MASNGCAFFGIFMGVVVAFMLFSLVFRGPSPTLHLTPEAALLKLYKEQILPVEKSLGLQRFGLPRIPDGEITSLPMVLLLGQYSTGKTSFIQHIIGMEYPDIHIGPDPTTDKFIAVVEGTETQTLSGDVLAGLERFPFSGLQQYGEVFLKMKFSGAVVPAPLLKHMHFIDTPGVLSGQKQRTQRGYNFTEVASWFAERSDMVLLFCDCSKLDISDEFREVIEALLPFEHKVIWILNKADDLDSTSLMQVYGELRGSMGNIFKSVEKARVYTGSFHNKPITHPEHRETFEKDRADLMSKFDRLPFDTVLRKITGMKKRVRQVQAHMLLMEHLRAQMSGYFTFQSAQAGLIARLPEIYKELQLANHLLVEDFPPIAQYAAALSGAEFAKFPKFDKAKFDLLLAAENEIMRLATPLVHVGSTPAKKRSAEDEM